MKRLSAQDRRDYHAATEAARTPDGFLQCQRCKRSLLDREARRHHRCHRSQGGKNDPANIEILCDRCHDAAHNIRRISPTARNGAVEDGDAPRLGGVEMPYAPAQEGVSR